MALNQNTSQLSPIPAGLSQADLVLAINDRLRRIGQTTAAATPAATAGSAAAAANAGLVQVTVTTSPYQIQPGTDVVTFQSGSSVATLPALAQMTRKPLWLINASSSDITLNPSGSDTENSGQSSMTLYAGGAYQLMPNA